MNIIFDLHFPQVTAGIDAVQIAGPPNFSQQKNIGIVNTLHRFQTLSQEVHV